jgi:hypothetical protein
MQARAPVTTNAQRKSPAEAGLPIEKHLTILAALAATHAALLATASGLLLLLAGLLLSAALLLTGLLLAALLLLTGFLLAAALLAALAALLLLLAGLLLIRILIHLLSPLPRPPYQPFLPAFRSMRGEWLSVSNEIAALADAR